MKRYAIWNKTDKIITPIGEVLTPEQWIERYPVAGVESITIVCAAGEINGGFFGTLGHMVDTCKNKGADFSNCKTAEDMLAVIEAFEDEQVSANNGTISNEELTATSLASIAASMEFQNMMMLEDTEV